MIAGRERCVRSTALGNNWEIVLIALVAIFLVLRLRSVLGRRTGNERPPTRDPFSPPPPNEQGQPGWRQQPGRTDAPSAGGTVIDLPRPDRPTPFTPLNAGCGEFV